MTTALAESKSKNTPKQLERHLWRPGQSGNPGGRPKGTTVREMRDIARASFAVAAERLTQLMKSENEAIALQAVQFAYLYALGKPQEGRDLQHSDALQARHQELVAVPVEQPQLEAPVAAEQTVVAAPSVAHPLPEQPPEAAGVAPVASVPSGLVPAAGMPLEASVSPVDERKTLPPTQGLRCLYRGKDGQCGDLALSTSQWCQTHRDRLFSLVPE